MFVNFCCSCSMRAARQSSSIRYLQTSAVQLIRKNYYEILGLKPDCSQKEIRNAFVVLSKAYHPDTNIAKDASDPKSNQEFIQLMEAYQVLSKSHSRADYDLSLKGFGTGSYVQRDRWKVDPSSYAEKGPNYSPYYGIKGFKRVSNWTIVVACVMFCALGVMVQAVAISRSITFKREQLDKNSAIYNSNHEKAKEAAQRYGNLEQLERVKQRLRKSVYDED